MNSVTMTQNYLPKRAGVDWVIIGVGDFDGDKISDIFLMAQSLGYVRDWLMNSSGLRASTGYPGTLSSEWGLE